MEELQCRRNHAWHFAVLFKLGQWAEAPSWKKSSDRIPYLSRWECRQCLETKSLHEATVRYTTATERHQDINVQDKLAPCVETHYLRSYLRFHPAQILKADFKISSAKSLTPFMHLTPSHLLHHPVGLLNGPLQKPKGPNLGKRVTSSHVTVVYWPTPQKFYTLRWPWGLLVQAQKSKIAQKVCRFIRKIVSLCLDHMTLPRKVIFVCHLFNSFLSLHIVQVAWATGALH